MNGIGGDLFAIVTTERRALHALDACGGRRRYATHRRFAARGLTTMPGAGVLSVTVPGVVERLGAAADSASARSTLARALAPAIQYAREGFPVAELIATRVAAADGARSRATRPRRRRSCPAGGRRAGARSSRTRAWPAFLEQIAQRGRDAFYTGAIAKAIAADMRARTGC